MYQHDCLFTDPMVGFLFVDSPLRHFSSQTGMIGVHEPPRSVEKSSDHPNWASIKTLAHDPLCHIKPIFGHISEVLLAPSPVLCAMVSQYMEMI